MANLPTAGLGGVLGSLMGPGREQAYDSNKFNIEFNTAKQLKRFENDLQILIETEIKQAEQGGASAEELAKIQAKYDKKTFQYFADELRDILDQAKSAETRGEVKTQLERGKATQDRIRKDVDLDPDTKQWLTLQFSDAIQSMATEIAPRKKSVVGAMATQAQDTIGQYLGLRSLFSGLVNNNPLAMGLYGIAGAGVSAAVQNRRRKKTQGTEDKLKYENLMLDRELEEKKTSALSRFEPQESLGGRAPWSDSVSSDGDTDVEEKQQQRVAKREADRDDQLTAEYRDGIFQRLDTIIELMGDATGAEKKEEEPGLFDRMKDQIGNFFGNLFGNMTRMLPMLLKGIGIATLIASLVNGLWEGITEGFDEFKKSGSISKAIMKGANALLSGLTFGLIDAETFENIFTEAGNWIGKKIFEAVDMITNFFSDMIDTIAEWVPGMESKSEAMERRLRERSGREDNWGSDTVDPEKLKDLTPEELRAVAAMDGGNEPKVISAVNKELAARGEAPFSKARSGRVAARSRMEASTRGQDAAKAITNRVNDVRNPKQSSGGSVAVQNNTVVNNNNGGGAGSVPDIPLTSARNPETTVQILAGRSLAFGST